MHAGSKSGTHTTALDSGRIAVIIIGSIASLLIIFILAFVCRGKLSTQFRTRVLRRPALSVKDKQLLYEDEIWNANTPRPISRNSGAHEIDGRMYPGIELETKRTTKELSSNEEVGHELAVSNLDLYELPS